MSPNAFYSSLITTNVAKRFLQLLDKHFPKGHSLHRLFSRSSVKVSYSCMKNMASIISGQNAKVLNSNTEVNNGSKECNCRKRDECLSNGASLTESIIYNASVSANNMPTKFCYGVTKVISKQNGGITKHHLLMLITRMYLSFPLTAGNFVINMISHMMISIYHGA